MSSELRQGSNPMGELLVKKSDKKVESVKELKLEVSKCAQDISIWTKNKRLSSKFVRGQDEPVNVYLRCY